MFTVDISFSFSPNKFPLLFPHPKHCSYPQRSGDWAPKEIGTETLEKNEALAELGTKINGHHNKLKK
jgi:hypothetical protein